MCVCVFCTPKDKKDTVQKSRKNRTGEEKEKEQEQKEKKIRGRTTGVTLKEVAYIHVERPRQRHATASEVETKRVDEDTQNPGRRKRRGA